MKNLTVTLSIELNEDVYEEWKSRGYTDEDIQKHIKDDINSAYILSPYLHDFTVEEIIDSSLTRPLINELSYACYKFNRERSPDVTPEQWSKVIPDALIMEKRFQKEKNNGG